MRRIHVFTFVCTDWTTQYCRHQYETKKKDSFRPQQPASGLTCVWVAVDRCDVDFFHHHLKQQQEKTTTTLNATATPHERKDVLLNYDRLSLENDGG